MRPNTCVRPGTWVTKQTGHIGYTRFPVGGSLDGGFRALMSRLRGASAAHSIRTRTLCRYDGLIFDHAEVQPAMGRVSLAVQSWSVTHRRRMNARRTDGLTRPGSNSGRGCISRDD